MNIWTPTSCSCWFYYSSWIRSLKSIKSMYLITGRHRNDIDKCTKAWNKRNHEIVITYFFLKIFAQSEPPLMNIFAPFQLQLILSFDFECQDDEPVKVDDLLVFSQSLVWCTIVNTQIFVFEICFVYAWLRGFFAAVLTPCHHHQSCPKSCKLTSHCAFSLLLLPNLLLRIHLSGSLKIHTYLQEYECSHH